MNIVSFTAVSLRFLSLIIFLNVLREISRLISLSGDFEYEGSSIIALLILGFFLFGMTLWIFSVKIAKVIIPKNISIEFIDQDILNDFHRPIYQLAFVLMGIYVLIYAISDFFYTAQVYFSLPDEILTTDEAKTQQALMTSSAIEALFGLILIIGARGVSAVIHKIRYGLQ